MQFGIYSSMANPPCGDDLDRCVDEVIAEAQLAEADDRDLQCRPSKSACVHMSLPV